MRNETTKTTEKSLNETMLVVGNKTYNILCGPQYCVLTELVVFYV